MELKQYTIQEYYPHDEPEYQEDDRFVVLDPEGFICIPEHFDKEQAEQECNTLNAELNRFKISKKLQAKTRRQIWDFLEKPYRTRKHVIEVFEHLMQNNTTTDLKVFREDEEIRGNQILISIFALNQY